MKLIELDTGVQLGWSRSLWRSNRRRGPRIVEVGDVPTSDKALQEMEEEGALATLSAPPPEPPVVPVVAPPPEENPAEEPVAPDMSAALDLPLEE